MPTGWRQFALGAAALCGVILGTAQPARAQVTTGNIVGNVKDQTGGTLPGASVVATHVPTGTVYQTVTDKDGRYQVLEVRVGGPYTVKVSLSGFKDGVESDVNVKLGEDREVSFTLELKTVSENVVVSAPGIDTTQPGAVANLSADQAASIPSIQRSLFDQVQVNPYIVGYVTNGNGQLSISIAGRNNRYNNIEIDGAVNNDIFGLSSTGTPEGQSNSQPISLDAIQEYQLLISPYDVRQGGFSGGGIDIVTRSGSNRVSGDGFIYWQNQSLTGNYFNPTLAETVNGTTTVGNLSAPSAPFSDTQGGGSVGGPIKKDRAFFFATSDSQREQTPSGIVADGALPTFGPTLGAAAATDVQTILSTLENKYGYNPAGSSGLDPAGNFNRLTNNDKQFERVDINLTPGERLTIRNNFINSTADSGTPTSGLFLTPDDYAHFHIKTDSTVGQLNSTINGSTVNELRLASTEVRNNRGGEPFAQASFPNIVVELAGASVEVETGTDNNSTANHIFQNDIELNDDLTSVHGNHTFSVGTHDEFFHFQNLFIPDSFGKYTFTSLANFESGLAQGYLYDYSNTGNPLQLADFRVAQYGAYAGDVWRVKPHLTITGGIRVDLPRFNSTPGANPLTVTDFGMATNVVPSPTQWSPRLGFAWDPRGNGRQVLRGGAGVFSGRTPYVWISNQFSNNGLEFNDISISTANANMIPFNPNPNAQPTSPTGANVAVAKQTVNLIDPNFKFPSQFRANLAYDMSLPWGMIGKGEVLFNKTLEDVMYENLNLEQTGTSSLDQRPLFTPQFPSLGPAILLTNTTAGHGYTLSYDVQRSFRNSLGFEFGYLYGQQKDVEAAGSSVALTNWEDVYAINTLRTTPPLTNSDFSPGQHVTANVSYALPVSHGMKALLSLVYLGQSGHPYTLSYSFDVNGDQQGFNDNLFLMTQAQAAAQNIQFTGGPNPSYQTFLNFLNSLGPCVTDQLGSIYVRNSCTSPWINTLNARLTFRLPFKRLKTDVTLDIFNLLNLLDDHWGLVKFVNFNQIDLINPFTSNAGPGATNPQLTSVSLTAINPTTPGTFSAYSIDDARSRWQMQLGLRIAF